MNPTHETDHNPAQPQAFGENFLVDLFTDKDRFSAWIASATRTAATPVDTGTVGYDLTDAGLTALDTTSSTCPVDLVTETDDEATARVLRSAALYLERHGWIQGAYYDATSGSFMPPACLVGAIGMVCYGGPVDAPAQHFDDPGFLDFEAAVLHLDRYLLAEDGSESYDFNDARGRQLGDITRVLRDAATRPAHELIDALRAIDQQNANAAALSAALLPGGVERCRSCGSSQRGIRLSVRVTGNLVEYCGNDWHGDSSDQDLSFDWSDVVDADGIPIPGRAVIHPLRGTDTADGSSDPTTGGAA